MGRYGKAGLALMLALAVASCRPAGQAAKETAPPRWQGGTVPDAGRYRYEVVLHEQDGRFGGWIELEVGGAGEPTRLSWDLGEGPASASRMLTADDWPRSLMGMGDAAVQAVLAATLLSPFLEHPVTLVEGWRGDRAEGEHDVEVWCEGPAAVAGVAGHLVRWKVRAAGVELDLAAVLAPGHALPLAVVLAEGKEYELDVRLTAAD